MPFQFRDLMITMLPRGINPGLIFQECDGGSENPPGPPPGPDSVLPSMLDPIELRAILQLALTQLGGPVYAGQLQPRSAAELQQLEDRLKSALAEVQATKARFGA